jgi:hypothetical protein
VIDTAIFACGSVFGLDALILVLLWLTAGVVFLANLCLILFQSRTWMLVHGLFASSWVACFAALWRGWGDATMSLLARLSFEFGAYVVPICVISQFVVLLAQTMRGGRWKHAPENDARVGPLNSSVRLPLVVAIVCLVVSGCTTPKHAPQPPSNTLRARFGTMALRLNPSTNAFEYELPATKGVAAGRGARAGAKSGLAIMAAPMSSGGASSGDGAVVVAALFFGLGVATTLVATPVGTVAGALRGVSADQLRHAEASVGTVGQTNLVLILRYNLLDAARVQANRPLLAVDELLPLPPGVQSVIEVEITYACLGQLSRKGINPPMGLELETSVRVIDTAADEQLYAYVSRFKSPVKRRFSDWAADDAKALRREFEFGCRALADDIVAQIFLRPAVADTAKKRPPSRARKDFR